MFWLIKRWVLEPARTAVEMSGRIATENCGEDLPEGSPLEVEQLQQNLELIQAHLQKRRQQLIESNQELRKARDEAMTASEDKAQFMANISHELRTPLNGVIGMSSLLAEAPLAEESRKMAETILRSGRSLSNLVNDVLDLSELERGSLKLEEAPFELEALLEEVISGVLADHPMVTLPVGFLVSPDVSPWVNGDRKRLRQVLIHLVSNAVKFTSEGEVEIRVDLASDASTPEHLRFSVLDTGVGVSLEKRETIFEAFTQGDESDIREFGGTGLGLPICQKIIAGMGGTIDFKARKPLGTEFFFEVTLAQADAAGDVAGPRVEPTEGESKTLLLLSPSGIEIRSLKARLSSWGWSPLAFHRTEGLLAHVESLAADGKVPPLICDHSAVSSCSSAVWEKLISRCPRCAVARRRGERETVISSGDPVAVPRVLEKPISASDLASVLQGFRSEIAIEAMPAEQPAPAASSDLPPPNDPNEMRVLVAEDNPINAMLVRSILSRVGLKPTMAQNGQQAVGEFLNGDFDLVLMDINMPIMDGVLATQKIREVCAERETHPIIIALTANAKPGDRERYIASGMDEYIQKPLTKDELLKTMSAFFPTVSLTTS